MGTFYIWLGYGIIVGGLFLSAVVGLIFIRKGDKINKQIDEQARDQKLTKIFQDDGEKTRELIKEIGRVDKVNYENLIKKYPFGYIIFAVDHDKIKLIPGPSHLPDDYEIDWNKASFYKLTSDVIGINLPDIKSSGGRVQNIGIEVHRVVNIPQRSPFQHNGFVFDLYVELLVNKDSQFILVLGLGNKQ